VVVALALARWAVRGSAAAREVECGGGLALAGRR
jgi:hypothetical protein